MEKRAVDVLKHPPRPRKTCRGLEPEKSPSGPGLGSNQ